MPDKGFKTLTVTEEVYHKVKAKAEHEKRSIASYTSQVLASILEADEKLSHYAPSIEVIGFNGNSVILRDHKIGRIVEVYLSKKEASCVLDNSDDCIHVSFCYALPQVSKVVRG